MTPSMRKLGWLLILATSLTACGEKQTTQKGAEEKTKVLAKAKAKDAPVTVEVPASAEGLLRLVPADTEAALLLLDWNKLYQLVGSLRASVGHNPLGKTLLAQAQLMSAASPLPFPWTAEELRRLGVETKRPLLAHGKRSPTILFSVTEVQTFKKSLVTLSQGKKAWGPLKEQGLDLECLDTPQKVHELCCAFHGAQAICSKDPAALTASIREKPAQTLWSRLSSWEQKTAASATVIVVAARKVVFARIEADGLTLQGRPGVGGPFASLMLAGASSSTLLGLAKNASSVIRVRLPQPLLGRVLSEAQGLKEMGLDAAALRANLTGELIALEHGGKGLAAVLACRDQQVSQQLVEALGKGIAKALKETKRKKQAKEMPAIKLQPAKLAGKPAFRLQITLPKKTLPLSFTVGLAAGPLGVLVGAWPAIEALAAIDSAPASDLAATLTTTEEREVFDEKALVSIRARLGDPINPFAGELKDLMKREDLPEKVREGIDLFRFLLDQMYGLTMGVTLDGGGPRFIVRLTTLHREGNAEDDKARALFLRGLLAKYSGDKEGHASALKELGTSYPTTRYATLQDASKGVLLTTATIGAMAAVAIPAFIKYIRRSKMTEVHTHLARIVSAAKFSHQSGQPAGGSGAIQDFPKSTPWTPAKPCCKSGGKCKPDPKAWDHPTWKALHFEVTDTHYYQYRFISKGKKGFVAEARGDLNCDGQSSSFSIEGTLQADGNVSLSPMSSKDPEE